MRKVLLIIGSLCLLAKIALAGWLPLVGATDLNFQTGVYYGCPTLSQCFTTTNSTGGTDLLYSSPSGASFNTFAANTPRITPGVGLLVEQARTNLLANSGSPATQTTPSLATGTYVLWVNGAGSATMSAGTATGCGTSAATQGTKVSFTISVAGTCVVTVAGSLNEFQLENDSTTAAGLSYCPSTINGGVCAADIIVAKGPLLTAFQQSPVSVLVQTYQITGGSGRILGYNSASINGFAIRQTTTQDQCFNGTVTAVANLGSGKNYATGIVKSSCAITATAMTNVAGNGTPATTAATAVAVTNVYIGLSGGTSDWVDGYIQEIIINGSSTPFSTN
jgi:hypothetical protein